MSTKKTTKKQQNEYFKKAMRALNAPFKKQRESGLCTYVAHITLCLVVHSATQISQNILY